MYKRTNNDLQNITEKSKERATQKKSIKTRGEPRCSGRVNSSCSTRGTRKVPKSNRKFVDTPSTHIHHLSPTPSTHIHHLSTTPSTHIHHLSNHGTGTSIKCGWIRLVFWSQAIKFFFMSSRT